MRMIPPEQIATRIMTLIAEADASVVVVSPYNDIVGWRKMRRVFEDARRRGVEFEYYARGGKNSGVNYAQLSELGITPTLVRNLHAKLYLNERYGIVTSLNLIESSDAVSLDVGFETESERDCDELRKFVDRYLRTLPKHANDNHASTEDVLLAAVRQNFVRFNVYYREREGRRELQIGGRNVEVEFFGEGARFGGSLRGILPSVLFEWLAEQSELICHRAGTDVRFDPPAPGHYCMFQWEVEESAGDGETPSQLARRVAMQAARVIEAVYGLVRDSSDPEIRFEL